MKDSKLLEKILSNWSGLKPETKTKIEKIKADSCNMTIADCLNLIYELSYALDSMSYKYQDLRDYTIQHIQNDVSNLYDMHYKHLEGHLPKISGAEKMQDALKALGLEKDYEVLKPVLYSFASSNKFIEVEYKKK